MAYILVPIPIIPRRPIIFTRRPCLLPRPDFYSIPFYGEKIHVTVAKKSIHVQEWIFNVLQFYGRRLHKIFVGLDTEWRPNFAPEDDHPVAIIQLCIGHHCLIFQLLHADCIPHALHAFLGDPRFTFCGVGVQEDVKKLYDHHGLRVESTMDLNEVAGLKCGRTHRYMGLKKMAMAVLGKEMMKPKEVTLSAWDAMDLDVNQVEYAAIDAIVSFQLASVLSSM
ncbi:hypothetical protein BUALT_Bualt09G0042900 [Buddleja alternifolia]|uniref:3'-5' exonuclease domain-containing protein n=1 Tax=Buddleja alternifolia TaxID=168488 RepID=A0AAV6WZX2_9LAMI|nr:hypothetical protein BUALT_Bualt09G0042900 [Buddleja alternifolia]